MDTRTGAAPPKRDDISELDKARAKIRDSLKQIGGLVHAVARPAPSGTSDGSELHPEEKNAVLKKIEGDLADLTHMNIKDIQTLINVQYQKLTGELTDDKDYLMEGIIRTAAKLPEGSANSKTLTDQLLTQLWNDLEHPPRSYLGPQYQYRSADGSFNSLIHPQLGAANTPYARTVKPSAMQTPCRPDAGVVFDSVMTRKHKELHPNRISSVLFYLASIIIHDLFRTDHHDPSRSLTSSYLDLAPLYGSNQKEQDMMRTHVGGKIKADSFAEGRLLFFPPGVGCLLIMFNRFHNHVVENLAKINENNRFPKPSPPQEGADEASTKKYEAALKKYDEDLFQTGRLITCGLYVNIILIDYVRTILNLNVTDSNWQLNPRAEIKGVDVAVGNQVSAEFNLVYRWHSTLSDRDEKWTVALFNDLFPGRDPKSIDQTEFLKGLEGVYRKTSPDPQQRNFAGLTRNADGTLPDDDLVKILTDSIEDCANSFGPNRVPAVMRAIEVLGIEQSRQWNLGTLNEFRKYFHLEPHRTFESITKDKYAAEQLKHLYGHPDRVEIYPGIVVEDAKQAMAPGSGLTPPYTVSRAVLSDAVALVRGDRFYTIDYNPRNLTNWGYSEVDTDLGVDNGCMFYKLFLRAFPNQFEQNSVYVHYPLTVPSHMEQVLKDLEKDHLYTFSKPKTTKPPQLILEYKTAAEILNNKTDFKVTWGKAIEYLMGKPAHNFMLAGDEPKNAESRALMEQALYIDEWDREVKKYYLNVTRELLQEKSAKIADFHQVDIIRDVGNLAHLRFCSEMFMLPLKTEEHPGVYTESELYMIMAGVFALVFFDADPAVSFPLHVKSQKATRMLGKLVQDNVEEIKAGGMVSSVIRTIWPKDTVLQKYGIHMIKRLLATGKSPEELVWGHILGTAGGMVANQGQLFAQTLEYYLNEGAEHWPAIQDLARQDTDEAFEKLVRYGLEGSRINGAAAVYREAARDLEIQDAGRTLSLKAGDRLFLHLRNASHDATAFPNPDKVDLGRPLESYIHFGKGPHECLGLRIANIALASLLKEVARLPGLRPAKGPQGKVHQVKHTLFEGEKYKYSAFLSENLDRYFPFPASLKVVWD